MRVFLVRVISQMHLYTFRSKYLVDAATTLFVDPSAHHAGHHYHRGRARIPGILLLAVISLVLQLFAQHVYIIGTINSDGFISSRVRSYCIT